MDQDRSYLLNKYIEDGGDSVVTGLKNLYFMGENKPWKIYRIPTDLLCFNVENGRFAAEKKREEKKLGYKIDSTNKEHEHIFLKLLLMDEEGKRLTSQSKSIMEDLKDRGQLEPGIITHDGFLINGNRRMACLKYLNSREPNSKYQYINVHMLPFGVPKQELYKLEIQLQIKKDYREKYNPINDLLKIKEGLNYMNAGELSKELGWDIRKIDEYQKRLDLVDDFLIHIGHSDDYTKVLDYNEHFVEFQKGLQSMKRAGIDNPEVEFEACEIFNRALKVNTEGYDKVITQRDHIRYIKDAFLELENGNSSIYEVLTKNLDNPDPSAEEVYNDVSAAVELVKMKKANDKPVEYLKRALNAISQIQPTEDLSMYNEEFMDKLNKIEQIIQELREASENQKV